MAFTLLVLLLLLPFGAPYTKEALLDQVVSLPRALSPLASNQFSGYLKIGGSKFIHYYYFESENDPKKDDVVFWTNGGPGCSGLLGLFTEMGPWRPTYNGSLERNPFAWTRKASMVFLEQPVGVGYSYTTDPTILDHFGDFQASIDNLKVVKTFFEKFPERSKQGFYLASESYGGHYIPQWTLQILNDPHSGELRKYFRGFLVGNPYTSYASGSIGMANVLWGLQLIPLPAWKLMTDSTCDLLSHDPYFLDSYIPECFGYLDALDEFAGHLNPYALEFPTCPLGSGYLQAQSKELRVGHQGHHLKTSQRIARTKLRATIPNYDEHYNTMKELLGVPTAPPMMKKKPFPVMSESTDPNVPRDSRSPSYDPCTEMYTIDYLNSNDVRAALHISPQAANSFSVCNDELNSHWTFTDVLADTTGLYSKIFNHPNKSTDFKMLVLSGDVDGVCATIGTQNWIYSINGSKVIDLYQPWMYDDIDHGMQVGGYLTTFTGRLSFATVRFAGHEVPAYQPQRAFILFDQFLNGSIFKVADSTAASTNTDGSAASDDTNSSVIPIVIGTLLVISVVIGWILCILPKSIYSTNISASSSSTSTSSSDEQEVEVTFARSNKK